MVSTSIVLSVIALLIIISIISSLRRKTVCEIVLKSFEIDESGESDRLVSITGRKKGLVAWFMTMIRIYPESGLTVYKDKLSFFNKSMSSESNASITYQAGMSHVEYDYKKSIAWLVLALLYIVGGTYMAANIEPVWVAFLIMLLGVIFIVCYFLKRTIVISVFTQGDKSYKIRFSPSVIEGKSINLEMAQKTAEIINCQIFASKN